MIRLSQPLIGEEEKRAVLAVLESGRLAQGPVVRRFEEAFARFVGVREAVAVSSGTAALIVALQAHGIGPGDEVITTPFTFAATANAILLVGARPVFVDVREEDFNIDPRLIEERITPRTRALLPVHLFGHPADMAAIGDIAARHSLTVIEDAAQAAGASLEGRAVGSFGTGCFSFYASKNMTTGEGGMITTNDPALAERMRLLRHHGQRQRYVSESLGQNLRLTEVAAALGLAQLEKLPAFNEARRANAAYLSERLRGAVPAGRQVITPVERPGCRHVYHQYTVRVPSPEVSPPQVEGGRRDALAAHLRQRGIETGVYYPVPLHRQPLYRDLGYADHLPVAERLSGEALSLPVHPGLTCADLDLIVDAVAEAVGERLPAGRER